MSNYSLKLQNVTKIFGRRLIFEDVNYQFGTGNVYGLAGRNGSGKSTLAKILAGVISPTRGKIIHEFTNEEIIPEKLHDHLGFVSPYLVLYDEFTAEENLIHFSKIRGQQVDHESIKHWLNEFELYDRRNDLLKGYSSGMKQRMKFIFALLHDPEFLIFDEPTSNLDNPGKEKVYEVVKKLSVDKLIIIASNEDNDLALCNETLRIENFKR